jgi:hypothetical protein
MIYNSIFIHKELISPSHKTQDTGHRNNIMKSKILEWFGVITAIMYSMMVALNIGIEFTGFLLLLISAFSIGYWAYLGRHKGILFLQFFYATAGIIGMVRWY